MASVIPDSVSLLSIPVHITATASVIGFDRRMQSPLLTLGGRPVTLDDIRRGGYESDELMFNDEQERKIEEAVAKYRQK